MHFFICLNSYYESIRVIKDQRPTAVGAVLTKNGAVLTWGRFDLIPILLDVKVAMKESAFMKQQQRWGAWINWKTSV